MTISETKMQMVIDNHFKDECDVNTSIRQAFEKGFRIGVKKGVSTNRPIGKWKEIIIKANGYGLMYYQHDCCCELYKSPYKYCPNCGANMEIDDERPD